MRFAPALAVLAVALVAAGCGARSSKPFTAKGTLGCLKAKGFTNATDATGKLPLIAAFAPNGGIAATSPNGNRLTIAFAENDTTAVDSTEKSFKLHAQASLRPHITDVMSANRNAVVVWTTTPVADDSTKVNGCLAP